MARDITLTATYDELVGDETYELWLKHETDAWALYTTDDVEPDMSDQQEIVLLALVEGDEHVAQIRLKRAGRYREGYLTANPDSWPSSSRVEFTPGALAGVGEPIITSGVWSRTSSVATKIALSITAEDLTKDLKVFRDAVLVDTIAAPHVNPVLYDDIDPSLAVEHTYTARHTAGFSDGPLSDPFDVFAGPPVPEDVEMTTTPTNFGRYEISWDSGGALVRIHDDFLCSLVFVNQGTDAAPTFERIIESDLLPDHGMVEAVFRARVRSEVVAFTVTDVSDWVEIFITCLIYDDNPDFNSCP